MAEDVKKEGSAAPEEAAGSVSTASNPTAAELLSDDIGGKDEGGASAAKQPRRKGGRFVPTGVAYVSASFNNTKVTVTDQHGNVLCWSSAGKAGFKGSRKSTAYAAQMVATDVIKKAQTYGMREVEVRIKGPGAGRESAVRGIAAAGMEISAIRDITPVPHNGCRPPKRRRA